MSILMILNDPPYGTERTYNGLRLAINLLAKHPELRLSVFLMGDAASSAKAGQRTPNGYYNVERLIINVLRRDGTVLACGTCLEARGLADEELIAGVTRSTMDELTLLTVEVEKVLVF